MRWMQVAKRRLINNYHLVDRTNIESVASAVSSRGGTALLSLGLLVATAHAQTKLGTMPIDLLKNASLLAAPLSGAAAIDACLSAITDSEQRYRIPAGLLLAIARTESGRPDPRTGRVQPWPWTVDVAGAGAYFPNAAEAVQHVTDSRQKGATSIDTGCLQVNLQQHPDAFKTLDDAFEPRSNVDYAARFLSRLHAETGDWARASCFYHSHTPELAIPYLQRVKAHLGGAEPQVDAEAERQSVAMDALKAAWGATLPADTPEGVEGRLVPVAASPGRAAAAGRGKTRAAARLAPASRGLPKVLPISADTKGGLLTGSCV